MVVNQQALLNFLDSPHPLEDKMVALLTAHDLHPHSRIFGHTLPESRQIKQEVGQLLVVPDSTILCPATTRELENIGFLDESHQLTPTAETLLPILRTICGLNQN